MDRTINQDPSRIQRILRPALLVALGAAASGAAILGLGIGHDHETEPMPVSEAITQDVQEAGRLCGEEALKSIKGQFTIAERDPDTSADEEYDSIQKYKKEAGPKIAELFGKCLQDKVKTPYETAIKAATVPSLPPLATTTTVKK